MTVKYIPKRSGVRALMRTGEMQACVLGYAEDIAAAARSLDGQSYGSRAKLGKVSAHGYAYTANWAAMVSNAENDTLSKALGGAR